MRAFETPDEVRQIAYLADGARLATCLGNVNGIHLIEWRDLPTGRVYGSVGVPGRPMEIAFALASRPEILAHPNGDQIHCFSQNTYNRLPVPAGRVASACALTPDGSRIAISAAADWRTSSIIGVAPLGRLDDAVEFRTGTQVQKMIFDPTGSYLVSIGVGQYTVWDLNRRESRTAGTLNDLRPVNYSHDGTLLAVAGNAGATIFTADGSPGTVRSVQRPGNAAVRALAFSRDNRVLLLAAGWNVHLFDADSGFLLRTYDWNLGTVFSIEVAPDGLTAAAGASGRVVIWDLDD